jgi:hypothetical protein
MKRINLGRAFVIAGLASQAIVYSALWVRMITSAAERTGTDFIAFYSAGRIALTGRIYETYLPQAQQATEESELGFSIPDEALNPFVHPPFIIPILALIANLPYVSAFYAWAIILMSIFAVAVSFLVRLMPPGRDRKVLIASSLLFFPVFVSILNGQDSALLLLGATIWLFGLVKGDDRLAGLGLALTTIRPHIALLLAILFLFKRRKVWWWFIAGAAGLAVFSFLVVGIKGTENFLHILTISASGEGYKINEAAMINFLGLLRRLVPNLASEPARLVSWTVYFLGIIFLCIIWARTERITVRHAGAAILVAILAAPHLHYHDLVLLLIPLFCVIVIIKNGKYLDQGVAGHFPLITSWLLIVSNFLPALKFSIPYLLGLILAVSLFCPGIVFKRRLRSGEHQQI